MRDLQPVLLEAARQVLAGEVSRDQITTFPYIHQQVYAAIAIMLLERERYLDSDGYVMGPLGNHLAAIIQADENIRRPAYATSLLNTSRILNLHRSERLHGEPSKRCGWRVQLTPPTELRALVGSFRPIAGESGQAESMQRAQALLQELLKERDREVLSVVYYQLGKIIRRAS